MRLYEFIQPIFEDSMNYSDIAKIISSSFEGRWLVLGEAKKDDGRSNPTPVVIRYCDPLYNESLKGKSDQILRKLAEFVAFKRINFTMPFNSKDYAFVGGGPIGKLGLGIAHAHLSDDMFVIYKRSGKEIKYLDLYGVFSHKDIGIGNSPNIRMQQTMAKRLKQTDCL